MKKQPPIQRRLQAENLLWWCIIGVCFYAFISCNHQTSSYPQTNIVKKPQVINDIRKDSFVARKVIPITVHNQPKVIKAGKPVIRIDSSNGGAPFFTNYDTEQGLPLNSVYCSATDKAGNLWFGTIGGGVSKYDGKSFTNYTIAHGLVGNVVFSMTEDKEGNMWFGTSSGVSKYDGFRFTNYTTTQGLAGNFISCIMQDSRGNLWFGSKEGGASKFEGKSFTNYTTAHGLADNYIRCMMQDKSGNIWFGTAAGGVSKHNEKNFTNYTTAQGLAGNSVNSIAQDSAGDLWFGTNAGVSKYNGNRFTNYTTAQGLADNDVSCIVQDKDGNMWFGTYAKGVSKFDGIRFRNYTSAQGLAENNISSILQDNAGNLWFTSHGGVSKYEGNSLTNYTTAHGLAGNLVFGILQDKAGNFWFGTSDGGVSKFDGKSFTNYTIAQGLADSRVWDMIQDKAENIWFATNKGGVSKYDGTCFTNYTTALGLASNSINCISQDKAGNIWLGTPGGASKFDGKSFTNYTTAQGLAGNVQRIIQDKAGNLWFGTHDDGVSKFDGSCFTGYTTAQGLVSNKIYSLIKDKAENIWVGTNAGVSKFDGKNFTNYTTEHGLADNFVWNIVEDQQRDMIWFGTNQGLSGLKEKPSITGRQDNAFENFNKNTGYPIKESAAGALLVDNNGIIWIGSGLNKLIRFDYAAVNKKNPEALNLKIQAVKVNNENICWNNILRMRQVNKLIDSLTLVNEMITSFGKVLSPAVLDSMGEKNGDIQLDSVSRFYPVPINLVLPYKDNSISIDFAAIEPALPKQVKYQYKLEGYTKDWSPLSNISTAVFGNMREGVYTFKLKAVSPFGVWSETVYSFKVLPPWWRTWWAYTLYALLIGGMGYTFYRNYIRGLKRKQAEQIKTMVATQEEERKRISKDLHDEVGIKLSALKLFLSSLSEKASATNNEEIVSLAQSSENLISEAMQDVRQLLLNLSPGILEEFGYTTAVEGLVSKINETERLHFSLVIFGMNQRLQKDYELTLYRITQELINNVLKHASARHVSLQIALRNKKIILIIEDDGRGFVVSDHRDGYGMHNLDTRTKVLNGILTIDSQPGKGTSVLIEIPYNFN